MSRKLPSQSESESQQTWIFQLLEHPVFAKVLLKCTPKFLFSMNMKEVYGDPERIKAESVDRYFELMLREGNREATLDRISGKQNSSIQFDRLTMPTLIMWGDLDRWIPVQQALDFEKEIPGSNLIIFEGVGHVPMEEIPTKSVAEYLSFLGVEVRKNYLQAPNYVSYDD